MMQPLLASSAYTVPLWLPTKTRPPATVGIPRAVTALGKPNAHFNVSFGVCSAVNPASAAGWKRVLVFSRLQPVHRAPVLGSNGEADVHRPADAFVAEDGAVPTYCAMARRWASVRSAP